MQKRKRKGEKKIMQDYTRKKSGRSEKLHTSIIRTKVCLHQENWPKFRIEKSNTREGCCTNNTKVAMPIL